MRISLAFLILFSTLTLQAAEPLKIGNDIQLLWDKSLIESQVNGSFKYHRTTPK